MKYNDEGLLRLAEAALKKARILRNENPTPVRLEDADDNLREEFSDVCQCACELDLEFDLQQADEKEKRFLERWADRG